LIIVKMAEELASKVENDLQLSKAENGDQEDDFVDPWTVKTSSDKGVDYDKLISIEINQSIDQSN